MAQKTDSSDDSYDFRGRRQNEDVLTVVCYHKWLLMPIAYVWAVIAIIIYLVMWHYGASKYTSATIAIGLLGGALYTGYVWFLWNGSNYIITNQRIIRVEQLGLFNREISEAEIDRIQEISTEIKGPIHTLFNFGVIHIKTASEDSKVDMIDVLNPYDIQQQVARVRQQITDRSQKPRSGGLS